MSFSAPLIRSVESSLRRGTRISRIGCASNIKMIPPSSSRYASTSSAEEVNVSSKSSTSGTPYPYSSSVITRSLQSTPTESSSSSSSDLAQQPIKSTKGRGIMASLQSQLRNQYDPTGTMTKLFSRNSSERVPPGSILIVETWNEAKRSTFSSFAGALIAIRRRNTSSSIVLRNLVNKTGVEQRFNIYSPLLKDIKIVQRAIGSKRDSRLRRARRAKLYYLRKDDSRLPNITRAIQTMRIRDEQQRSNDSDGQARRSKEIDGKKRK